MPSSCERHGTLSLFGHQPWSAPRQSKASATLRYGGASQRKRPHAREVLEVIAYKRVTEEIDTKKTEHRKQRDDIVRSGKEQSTASFSWQRPQEDQTNYYCHQRHIGQQLRWINRPPRINENERIRPDEFRQVKPYRATSDNKAFRPGLRPVRTNCGRVKFLFPNCPHARKRRNKQEWSERYCIFPSDPSSPPPHAEGEHDGQHDH